MANDIGSRIGIEGEAEYKKALSGINSDLKTLSTEMKAVTSEFIGNEKSVKSLTAQNEVLTKQYDEQAKKVDLIRAQLEKATAAYGEDDAYVKRLQQSLNLATADMNKTKAQIDANTDAINNFGKEEDDASEKTSRFGDILKANLASEAIVAGIKALGGAIKDIASSVGDIVKASVSAFAENEQLIGGVETLFGESSAKVQEYAANAYKTAGLSANEYMAQVTSFSASLLQGLGGDTAKAADIADMAMADMSDNANKMGTDMGSIQTAYQGFAKGQYALLDNLKLGYGGTKTEMERLLADAEAFSGVHYDISNLSDVYSAIHVVQQEMGITGTTAKEASTTIEGSLGAVKSSWQNLIAGLGNPSADVSMLANNVIAAAQNVLANVVPVINSVVDAIPSALETIINAIVENIPTLMDTALEMFNNVVTSVTDALPELVPVIVQAVTLMSEAIIENLPMIIEAALQVVLAIANGIVVALPNLIPSLISTVNAIVDGLIANLPLLIEAALQIIVALATGLITNLPELIKRVPEIIKGVVGAIKESLPMVLDAGVQIVKGLWEGIKSAGTWLRDQIAGFFNNLISEAKEMLGIHSPSRVFAGIGKNMALGLGEGWDSGYKDIQNSILGGMGGLAVPVTAEATLGSSVVGGIQSIANGTAGDIVINLTSEMDGAVLARMSYRYNQAELKRHGGSLARV